MVGRLFCSDGALAKQKATFFAPRIAKFNGGPRMLAQSIEAMESCITRKNAQQASLAEFFRNY